MRDVLGQGGLAGSRRTIEAQGAKALSAKCLDDLGHFKARLGIDQRKVVLRNHPARTAFGGRVAQRLVGIAQLPLDERLDTRAVASDLRELHRRADLRRCEAAAAGQAD